MRSKLSAMTAFTPSSIVPFAAQSRDEPVPYSRPAMIDERRAFLLVAHGRVVDGHLLAARHVNRDAAFDAGHHQIAQADVRERSAHHHFVIAAPGTVGIEVHRLHALLDEISRGRARLRDVAGGRDVIRRDRVAEQREHARALDVADRARASSSCRRSRAGSSRRWTSDPTRSSLPAGIVDRGPVGIAREHARVALAEHLRSRSSAAPCPALRGRSARCPRA